jgi:hypothetical protein
LRITELEISSTSGAAILGFDRLAHAGFLEHRDDGFLALGANLGGAFYLVAERGVFLFLAGVLAAPQFAFDFGFAGFARHAFFGGDIEALGDVDPDFRCCFREFRSRSFGSVRTNFVRQNGCSIQEPQNSCRCMPRVS